MLHGKQCKFGVKYLFFQYKNVSLEFVKHATYVKDLQMLFYLIVVVNND